MKNLYFPILLITLSANFSFAQKWLEFLPTYKSKSELSFYDYQNAFDKYQKSLNAENGYYRDENGERNRVSGFKQFKRWEYYLQGIIDPSTGAFPTKNPYEIYAAYQRNQSNNRSSTTADWKSLGPNSSEGGYAGIGRLNCISFHPTDTNTYWVGAASGGLWVTNDDGANWTCLTDKTGVLAVSDIVIPSDYETSNTIYIATGDRDAWDNRSIGVLKSTNRGVTWNTTGLTFSIASPKMVNRLLIDPNNNEILIAATTDGVFKTINGGVTWNQQISNQDFIDMEFKPNDFNTLYGAVKYDGKIYTSTNGGMTWTIAYSNSNINRIELAVSENQNGWVYGVASDANDNSLYGILKSTNSGGSFQRIYSAKNLLGWAANGNDNKGQGWYDLSIEVSKNDANTIIVGGINSWRSINGGTTWQLINHWVGDGAQIVHADKHQIKYRNNGDLFECNDGGIYVSKNNGTTWIDKSNGLVISQIYKLGNSQYFSNEVITGLQDNGTKLNVDSVWVDVFSGDGMNCIIDPNNNNIQYACSQYGKIGKTLNHWRDIVDIKPPNSGEGAWVTPYVLDPNDPATIYAGYSYLYKSIDRGATWTRPNPNSFWSLKIHHIAIAPSNSNTLYLAGYDRIWKTIDGGKNVFNIANNLPLSSGNITSVSVKNDDENTVWVTLGGYTNPGVFQSTNGGQTWVNISNGLPLIPAYTIVQNNLITNEIHLYLGSEIGVYFKKGNDGWIPYNQDLPNVKIGELEIYYDGNPDLSMLRAGTYGRGLWESPLTPSVPIPMSYVNALAIHSNLTTVNPSSKNNEIIRIQINMDGSLAPKKIKSFNFKTYATSITYDIENVKLYYTNSKMQFDTNYLVGTSINVENDTILFNIEQELSNGKNYFWLTYDVKSSAVLGHFLDAQLISFELDTVEYLLNLDPIGNRVIELNYCTAGSTLPTSYNYISNVTIGKINNNSTKGQSGYQNFRNISDSLSIGQTIDFKINLNQPFPKDQIRIWVDFNRNGIFEDTNELVYFSPGINTQPLIQGSFYIPFNAIQGTTTMRIRQHYTDFEPNFTSCGTSSWGEVEDYSVILYQRPIAGHAFSNSPICVNDSLIIQLQNFFGNIKWQKSKNGLTDWQYCNEGLGYDSSYYKSFIDTSTFFRAEVVLENLNAVYSNIVEVIVNQNPEVYINSTNGLNFCSSETSTLYTESNYYSYSWNTGDTMPSIEVATNGSYFVNVVDNNGCSGTSNTIQITVNQSPTESLSIFGPPTFCFGDSIVLTTESIDFSFLWSTNDTSQSIIVTESGIFWVTVTDSNGCSAVSDSIIVTVNPLPIANITPSDTTTFCDGNSVTLLVNEASSYLWSNNSDNRNIIVTQSGNYSVTITDSNGCSAVSDSIIVTVNPLPFVIITPSDTTTFCDGNSVTLSANEASSYLWSNNSGNINITVTQSGNYSLTITDANGCTGESEIISVTVDTLPQPIITPDGNTSFCEGGSVQLHGGNFQTYIWSTGETSQNITVSTTGDYTVTVTDSNGCTGISPPITVNVNDILFVEIIYDGDNNICPDESIILQSSVTGIEYSWNTNESTASIIVSEAGTYQLSVTDANGCTGISDQVTINEFTVSDIEIDTIGMTTFCAGDSVILTSSSSATYHWSNGSSSQETTIYNAGNYNVTVTDANGCRNTSDNVTISVLSLPEPVITPNSNVAFCEGGSVILQTSSFEKYKWSSGETTSAIVVDHSGTFVVTVEDSNGCSGISEPISVIEYENPIVEIQSLSGNTICDGDSTTLISSIEGISYSWNTNETTDKIVISTSGSYQLTITDQNGCEGASEPFEVTVLPLPMIQIDTIGNTAFCSGDSVILRCNEAVAYLWNNGHTTREFKAFTTGSFQVTITGENNCKNNSEIIQVTSYSNPVPQLNLTGNISLCTGDSISLFTEEGYVYLWNTGDNSQLINISEEGSYWVNVIDQNGCTGISDVVSLSLDTLPDVEILLIGNDTICQGEMVTLKAINAVSYVWNSGQIGSEILITVSGQYRVEGTNSQGCSQVESIWIIVKENLEPMVTISSPQNSVCEGDLVVFTSSVTNEGINPSYQWFVNGVDQLVNLPEFSTNTLENGASVFCRMTSDEQCLTKPFDNSNSISVAVNDIVDPKIEIISVPEILYECLEYEFNADLTNQGSIPEVKWFINGILISDSLSFVYADFKAGDKLYCSLASSLPCVSNALVYSDTISLNISPLPLPVIIFSNDSISSTNYQSSDYSYNWYVNGQLVSNQQIISCQEYGNGNYYLEISVNGCTVTSQILNVANCTVSSEDILKYDQIVVFPNPTTGILNILSRNNSYPVNIIGLYDGIGRKIAYNQIEKENIIQLDLSSFSTGVYFIKIANQSVIKEVKIIKF